MHLWEQYTTHSGCFIAVLRNSSCVIAVGGRGGYGGGGYGGGYGGGGYGGGGRNGFGGSYY